MYLSQCSGEFAPSKISSSSSCQWDPIPELIQRHILLDVLGELNPRRKREKRNNQNPQISEKKKSSCKSFL